MLETVAGLSGYCFHHYSPALLQRRLAAVAAEYDCNQLSGLIPLMLRNNQVLVAIQRALSITVSAFFRDPERYAQLRRRVLPLLHSFPFINIWSAGCARGEEAYSLAILLEEEGLLERCRIYATDFNTGALALARQGCYSINQLQQAKDNYLLSGGHNKLEDYVELKKNHFQLKSTLRRHIVFAQHNLIQDQVFAEMNLIQCSNVMIYFDATLKQQCLQLFYDSLSDGGYLSLGNSENIGEWGREIRLRPLADAHHLYRKCALPDASWN